MVRKNIQRIEQKYLKIFCAITIALFFIGAFSLASPRELIVGMKELIIARDALITDYFKLVGYGTAFFNSAVMMCIVLGFIHFLEIPFTGLSVAVFFINAGFALFGKNPVNSLPILFGTYLYARQQGVGYKRYVYTGLFGTCLAPLVTEMVYILPFGQLGNLIGATLIGIMIGFVLPALAMHTASMHMGYCLFNVGFAAGIVGFIIICVLKGFGIHSETAMIWQEGLPKEGVILLYGYFIVTFFLGVWVNKGKIKPALKIARHPGRAVADFVLMDGVGSTMINMAVVGSLCLTYIVLIGGDLSGPVVGGILSIFGFAAFGVHPKNYLPCILGIYLGTLIKIYEPTMPAIQLAALFSAGIAPIAGQFGVLPGILAGILHTSIVMCTSALYAGLNLYNNGFAAGFVAIFMVPLLESFIKKYNQGNSRR